MIDRIGHDVRDAAPIGFRRGERGADELIAGQHVPQAELDTHLIAVIESLAGDQRLRAGRLPVFEIRRAAIRRPALDERRAIDRPEQSAALQVGGDADIVLMPLFEMKRLQQRLGISFIYVTHNQSEAFSMADRIVVMDKGHIDQIGSPKQLCLAPKTRFTAQFVGTNNIIDGKVQEVRGRMQLTTARKMDDARVNEMLGAIRNLTKLNRDIWDFLPRLKEYLDKANAEAAPSPSTDAAAE